MSFEQFEAAPSLRPFLNLGCLLDIPTGKYYTGKRGESVLNGGLSYLTGIGGRGNTFKSTIAHYMTLVALDRYANAKGIVYDTEMSLTIHRMHQLAAAMPMIGGLDLAEDRRLIVTDATIYQGNKFFALYKEGLETKRKDGKKNMGATPFLDRHGEYIQAFYPSVGEIDSFSQFSTDSVEKIQDGAELGEAGRNIEAMRGAMAKNQMMMELPGLTGGAGAYLILTAHMGDTVMDDPYAPAQKKLGFLKNKVKFKNVPEKFTFLMNNCWYCLSADPLINQTTKGPEFPRHSDDKIKGDPDLMVVKLQNLRAKSGPTGMPFELLVSQSEGVLVGLSEFNYIKTYERFGLGGHDKSYYLELLPDVNLQRTTIRGKIDDNAQLRRALEITSEMCQMKNLWHHLPDSLLCTPKELYEDLKAKGYDWDRLLNTRGYWVFNDVDHPLDFLSTMDLLNMRAGTYHPYWYGELPK